jgi:quinol monooxygenase YgiN
MENNFTDEELQYKRKIIVNSMKDIAESISHETGCLKYEINNNIYDCTIIIVSDLLKQMEICCKLLKAKKFE